MEFYSLIYLKKKNSKLIEKFFFFRKSFNAYQEDPYF